MRDMETSLKYGMSHMEEKNDVFCKAPVLSRIFF